MFSTMPPRIKAVVDTLFAHNWQQGPGYPAGTCHCFLVHYANIYHPQPKDYQDGGGIWASAEMEADPDIQDFAKHLEMRFGSHHINSLETIYIINDRAIDVDDFKAKAYAAYELEYEA